jgi:hypothetical protein
MLLRLAAGAVLPLSSVEIHGPALEPNTCRGDTDPGKHLEIVSAHQAKVPGGQSAGGCAGTTHG